jgi:hypothetical protein
MQYMNMSYSTAHISSYTCMLHDSRAFTVPKQIIFWSIETVLFGTINAI